MHLITSFYRFTFWDSDRITGSIATPCEYYCSYTEYSQRICSEINNGNLNVPQSSLFSPNRIRAALKLICSENIYFFTLIHTERKRRGDSTSSWQFDTTFSTSGGKYQRHFKLSRFSFFLNKQPLKNLLLKWVTHAVHYNLLRSFIIKVQTCS